MSVLIKNGTIVDGTGKERFQADLLIENDKISAIEPNIQNQAEKTIDAKNLIVAPGFVDILSHSDAYLTLFSVPSQESLLQQGISTILLGNCGSSLAPLVRGEIVASVQKWGDIREFNVNWERFGEFLEFLSSQNLGVNVASLVGHSTLRRGLIGDEMRTLHEEELKKMRYLLEQALEEGAFGLSFAPAYVHARMASKIEMAELALVLKKKGGILASHLRSEEGGILGALDEVLQIAQEAEISLEISHLKVAGQQFYNLWPQVLEKIESASQVNFDLYPYITRSQVLYLFLPDWVQEGGRKKILERLRNRSLRKRIVEDMTAQKIDYNSMFIAVAHRDRTYVGKKIIDIAQNQGKTVQEAICDILVANEGRVIVFSKIIDPDHMRSGAKHPLSFFATAAAGYDLSWSKKGELVHPRAFGAFPKVLSGLVRKEKLLSLEQAVHKISGGPAGKIGLKDRGVIAKGKKADLCIFDPEKIKDRATLANPYQYPTGIKWVLVNGQIAINPEGYTGIKAGQVIKSS